MLTGMMLTRTPDGKDPDSAPTRGKATGVSRWPGVLIALGLILTLAWVFFLAWLFLKIVQIL